MFIYIYYLYLCQCFKLTTQHSITQEQISNMKSFIFTVIPLLPFVLAAPQASANNVGVSYYLRCDSDRISDSNKCRHVSREELLLCARL